MRVLIVGGTGLISTALTEQLLAQGQEVTLFNRGKSAVRFAGEAQQIHGDRKEVEAFEAQMRNLGTFDAVVDMICYTPEDARSTIRAFAGQTPHLLFCSTVDVYARPVQSYPIREDAPRRPFGSDYAGAKSHCESLLEEAHERDDFALTILRPAHTYGDPGTLVHSFGGRNTYLDRLRKGKPIVVHGDGSSLWASARVEDVARAFVGALQNPASRGKAYNVAADEWLTWNEYHRQVARALDAPAPTLIHIPTDLLVKAAPKRAGVCEWNFQHHNAFDNSTAHRDLGYRSTISFAEGARRTVQWLDANHRIENSDKDTLEDRVIGAWQRLSETLLAETAGQDD